MEFKFAIWCTFKWIVVFYFSIFSALIINKSTNIPYESFRDNLNIKFTSLLVLCNRVTIVIFFYMCFQIEWKWNNQFSQEFKWTKWIVLVALIPWWNNLTCESDEIIPQAIWCVMAVRTLILMTKMDTNEISVAGKQQQSTFLSAIKCGPTLDLFLRPFCMLV